MISEKEGICYKVYNDLNGIHVANIIYNKDTDKYMAVCLNNCCGMPPVGLFGFFEDNLAIQLRDIAVRGFLEDRVVPPNRDMLKETLESMGIYEYDWRVLIRLNHGRSVDDDFSVEAVTSNDSESTNE